jgi:hypothetical protein
VLATDTPLLPKGAAAVRGPMSNKSSSSVTNRTHLLPGLDKGSTHGRRYRDLIYAFAAELGVNVVDLPESEMAVIRQAASATAQSERVQAEAVKGLIDARVVARIMNVQNRALKALGALAAAKRRVARGPALDEYLAAKRGDDGASSLRGKIVANVAARGGGSGEAPP